jgi:hypothetical protein
MGGWCGDGSVLWNGYFFSDCCLYAVSLEKPVHSQHLSQRYGMLGAEPQVLGGCHSIFIVSSLALLLAHLRDLSLVKASTRCGPLSLYCLLCVPLAGWGLWLALRAAPPFVLLLSGLSMTVAWLWCAVLSLLTRHWGVRAIDAFRRLLADSALVCCCLLLPSQVGKVRSQGFGMDAAAHLALFCLLAGQMLLSRSMGGTRGAQGAAGKQEESDLGAPLLSVVDGDVVVDGTGMGPRGPEGRANLISRLTFW